MGKNSLRYPGITLIWERFKIFTGNHRLFLYILHFAANTTQKGRNDHYISIWKSKLSIYNHLLSLRTMVLSLTTLFWWKYVVFSTSRKLMVMPTNQKVTELWKDLIIIMKSITCLCTLINTHSITWGTWIPHDRCALNTQINSITGETPHYILFGEDKVLPYSLLESEPRQLYNYGDYILTRINKFKDI